jgi:hypothetical protein
VALLAVVAIIVARTETNKEAIEVTCLLVVQVVRDSGANSGQPVKTRVGEAQRRLSAAYTTTLQELMPRARRERVNADIAIIREAGGSIPEPDCRAAAEDPGRVKRETLQSPKGGRR